MHHKRAVEQWVAPDDKLVPPGGESVLEIFVFSCTCEKHYKRSPTQTKHAISPISHPIMLQEFMNIQ